MRIKTRIAAIAAGLVLCGAASRARAHDCHCGWAYGSDKPTGVNSWVVGTQVMASNGCDRQQECVGLCNQPGEIAEMDRKARAAVADYCTAHNLTSGQAINVYYKSQAGAVVGAWATLRNCVGWMDAGQTFSQNCPGSSTLGGGSLASPDTAILPATAAKLKNLRDQVRPWAVTCAADGTLTDDPTVDCAKDYDDMTLFSGLSCAAGETSRCLEVKNSQGPDGRWWRNPKNVNVPRTFSFSRDATEGLLDYFLTLNETDHNAAFIQAKNWMEWVQDHHNQTCTTPVVTLPTGNLLSPKVDDKCYLDVDPSLWPLVGQVMDAIRVPIRASTRASMIFPVDQFTTMMGEADTNASGGYTLHLVAIQVELLNRLRREYGKMSLPNPQQVARRIASAQPMNPFFAYLYHGRSEYVAQKVLDLCPAVEPSSAPVPLGTAFDWAWQRADSGQIWKKSMGWDCIYMVNLLLGPGPVVPPTCAAPQSLNSQGVCQCPSGTSAAGTNLAGSQVCACPIRSQTYANGACACPHGQSLVNGACTMTLCPPNQVYSPSGSNCCAVGQILDPSGNCTCPNNEVLTSAGTCGCRGHQIQTGSSCGCPYGASLVPGDCQCNISTQVIQGGVCVCPPGQGLLGGTCAACPPNSLVSAGSCVCMSGFSLSGNACVPMTGTGH